MGQKQRKCRLEGKNDIRIEREIRSKEGLLQDIEKSVDLKLMPQKYYKDTLIYAQDYTFQFRNQELPLISHFNFSLKQGERIFLHGKNGCGKSTFMKQILAVSNGSGTCGIGADRQEEKPVVSGELKVCPGLHISYISQDTGFLHGTIKEYCRQNDFDESLFLAILRQLDMDRVQFEKTMENYSEGQKKKVLIAGSLLTPAHLYIWDEPLNYIDVFSRIQIENLILKFQPTMLVVEHDVRFRDKIATKIVEDFK